MKARFRISREAQHDLGVILVHVVEASSVRTAERLIDRIVGRIATIARFPDAGESCEDMAPGARRVVAGDYLVYYRKVRGIIVVSRVLPGKREQKTALRKFAQKLQKKR